MTRREERHVDATTRRQHRPRRLCETCLSPLTYDELDAGARSCDWCEAEALADVDEDQEVDE